MSPDDIKQKTVGCMQEAEQWYIFFTNLIFISAFFIFLLVKINNLFKIQKFKDYHPLPS